MLVDLLKPPMDTMQAIAMILGLKICFAPPDSITGFFSTSLIEDSFERRSSCIFALSTPFSIAEAMIATKKVTEVKLENVGTPQAYKPALYQYSMAP
jgi:hypothetical protein